MKDKTILKGLLWDADIEKIDPEKNSKFIIERVLKYGLTDQVNWLLDNYSEQSIVEVVKKSKNIDKKKRRTIGQYIFISLDRKYYV